MTVYSILTGGFGTFGTVNKVPTHGFVSGTAPSTTGQIKTRIGASFVSKPVKVWNGASWVVKPLKYWNGSSWITTPY